MGLLISAGLFLKSLVSVSRVDVGVAVDDVVTFAISPSRVGYDTARSAVLLDRVAEELRAIPGVTGVPSSMVPLLAGSIWGTDVRVQGFDCGPDTDCNSRYSEVGPDYFEVLGMELIAGRGIQATDLAGGTRVAVVNEVYAGKFGLGADAVGKYMGWGGGARRDSIRTLIVGLALNAGYSSVKNDTPPVFYARWKQNTRTTFMNFYVRTALPPERLLTAVPALMMRLDASLPVEGLRTMPRRIARTSSSTV